MRVLIIDDDQDATLLLQLVCKDVLDTLGYRDSQIITAVDGRIGLQLLREEGPFDLVITDQMMPFVEGVEVLATVRSGGAEMGTNGTSRYVPIGLFTADRDIENPSYSGFNFRIPIPSSLDEIRDILKEQIHKMESQSRS